MINSLWICWVISLKIQIFYSKYDINSWAKYEVLVNMYPVYHQAVCTMNRYSVLDCSINEISENDVMLKLCALCLLVIELIYMWMCVCNINICHSLWNLTVYYCVYKSPPFVPVLKHINMLHAMPYHSVSLIYILILSFPVSLGLTNGVSYHNPACILFTLMCVSWLVFTHSLM